MEKLVFQSNAKNFLSFQAWREWISISSTLLDYVNSFKQI